MVEYAVYIPRYHTEGRIATSLPEARRLARQALERHPKKNFVYISRRTVPARPLPKGTYRNGIAPGEFGDLKEVVQRVGATFDPWEERGGNAYQTPQGVSGRTHSLSPRSGRRTPTRRR